MISLGVISLFFGIREGKRTQQRVGGRARMSPTFWKRFHWACAAAIGLALLFIGVTEISRWFNQYSLIIGETAAVIAFGLSWLMKGLELNILLGPKAAAPDAAVPATVDA